MKDLLLSRTFIYYLDCTLAESARRNFKCYFGTIHHRFVSSFLLHLPYYVSCIVRYCSSLTICCAIQTSSRKAASLWLCYVHNLVNKRLGKEEFDCTKLDDTYDCGCGDDPLAKKKNVHQQEPEHDHEHDHEHEEDEMYDEETGERLIKGG
jgi:hypothetical protein